MKHGLPLYVLVANDDEGHAWLIAFALMSHDTSEVLARFLEVVWVHIGGKWAPTIMINKDATKCAVVWLISWDFVLCNFHIQQAWCQATTWYHNHNCTQASNHPASSGEEEEEPVSITITPHKKKFVPAVPGLKRMLKPKRMFPESEPAPLPLSHCLAKCTNRGIRNE